MSGLVVVERLTEETVSKAVAELVNSGEYQAAFDGPYLGIPLEG